MNENERKINVKIDGGQDAQLHSQDEENTFVPVFKGEGGR
jgi:hypothetical protein